MDESGFSPKQLLRDISQAFIRSQAVYAVAKSGVADHIGEEGASIANLAHATGAHEEALYRVMRYLTGLGVFREGIDRRFTHTPASQFLRADHEQSDRGIIIFRGEEQYAGYGEIMHSLCTQETGFNHRYGHSLFDYLKINEEVNQSFQSSMRSFSNYDVAAVLKAYDFSNFNKIVDVGGGNGTTLSAILAKNPDVSGILFDLEGTIDLARAGTGGPLPRCELVTGNFFDEVASGGDLYILKGILHDWYDAEATEILRNCRQAMSGDSKLLIIERLIGPPNQYNRALEQDMTMMVIVGGKERREEEFKLLLEQTGLQLHQTIDTDAGLAILECRPI